MILKKHQSYPELAKKAGIEAMQQKKYSVNFIITRNIFRFLGLFIDFNITPNVFYFGLNCLLLQLANVYFIA